MGEIERLKSHFLNLYSLALSDNEVAIDELQLLYDIGINRGFKKEDIDYIIDNPHKINYEKPQSKKDLMEQVIDFTRIILADGKIDLREVITFRAIAKKIGLEKENMNRILDTIIENLKNNKDECYILNILLEDN